MLRQLGHFQVFMTLTSSEAYDKDVCVQLLEHDGYIYAGKPELRGEHLYDYLIAGTAAERKYLKQLCKTLARKHATLMVRLYDRKKSYFFKNIMPNILQPHTVTDYLANDEFGSRGNQHTHALLTLSDVLVYNADISSSKAAVIRFVDSICSCSLHGLTEHQRKVQTHKHINCKKKGNKCRFRFPRYPMLATDILDPIPSGQITQSDATKLAHNLDAIKLYLQGLWNKGNVHTLATSVEDMLHHLGLTYDEYILAIRSALHKPEVFLKRNVNAIQMNNYMLPILRCWGANMDIQFVLDPYAAIEYICNYITKGPRGMSDLMKKLTEQARVDNMTVPDFIMKKANLFFNRRETSLNQALCTILDLPLRLVTRDFVYIPTCPADERVCLLKSKDNLDSMEPTMRTCSSPT